MGLAITGRDGRRRHGAARPKTPSLFGRLSAMSIRQELRLVVEEQRFFTGPEAESLLRRILAGEASDLELASLLGGMSARGETAEELAGFARAMRSAATTLPLTASEQDGLVDTCGTGGDGTGTFNISTAAALVAAAAGVKVAKHGNRAVTSRCGSADVLEALGVPISLSPEAAAEVLKRHNFCFLLAPSHHPAMQAVLPVRRALGVRSVFNVLGPLLNPAGARRQVMGVYAARLVPVVAQAMVSLGMRHAFVVHGDGGLDELSLSGPTEVAEVDGTGANTQVRLFRIAPEDLGLQRAPLSTLQGADDAEGNAAILRRVLALDGVEPEMGPRRDVVLLNTAAVLVAAGHVPDFAEGVRSAAATVGSGAVDRLVTTLRASSSSRRESA